MRVYYVFKLVSVLSVMHFASIEDFILWLGIWDCDVCFKLDSMSYKCTGSVFKLWLHLCVANVTNMSECMSELEGTKAYRVVGK